MVKFDPVAFIADDQGCFVGAIVVELCMSNIFMLMTDIEEKEWVFGLWNAP